MSRATTLLAVGLLALVVVNRPASRTARSAGVDFVQFWLVGQAAPAEPYTTETRASLGRTLAERAGPDTDSRLGRSARFRVTFETFSSPTLYAAFGAAATGDYDDDLGAYHHVSLLALLAGAVMAARAAGLTVADGALLAAVLLFSSPAASDEHTGNVTRIQVGLLGAAALLLARGTDRTLAAAGLLLGAAVLFKPNVVFAAVAPLVVRLRAGQPAGAFGLGLAGGALVAFVAGALWFGGIGVWWQWLHAVPRMPGGIIRPDMGNWGLVSLVATHLGRGPALAVASLPVLVFTAILVRRQRVRSDVAALALGGVAWLLVSPLTWLKDYLLATPAMAVGLAGGGWPRALAAVALLLTTTPPPPLLVLASPTVWCLVYGAVAALLFASVVATRWSAGPYDSDHEHRTHDTRRAA